MIPPKHPATTTLKNASRNAVREGSVGGASGTSVGSSTGEIVGGGLSHGPTGGGDRVAVRRAGYPGARGDPDVQRDREHRRGAAPDPARPARRDRARRRRQQPRRHRGSGRRVPAAAG